ncbi:hypothetical protein ASG65_26455 [Bacillus sp. Leaf13]|nr:hypothetical protein ASG65_26455 [Bacillus sp. Leaf13]
MAINLNRNLIEEFRDKVNERPIFQEKLRNVKGKNHWNVICSAMDWISVAAEGLPAINLEKPKGMGYDHLDTINLMQYIITVDILVESITQLFRVIDGTNSHPLSKNSEIFKQSKLSDDDYFKHIRAVFSTHPVNLKSVDGVKREDGERFFASWVARSGVTLSGPNDFYVLLYSNDPKKDQVNPLGIKVEDINLYAEKRYKLLENLIKKVDHINTEHLNSSKQSIIPTVTDPVEQLKILSDENKKRFGTNFGYGSGIQYLYRLLKVNISSIVEDPDKAVINEYRSFMLSLIPDIKDGLQDMTLKKIHWKRPYKGYTFQKVYTYFADREHPIGEAYFNKLVEKGFLSSLLATCEDFDLKQLVMDAYLHKKSTEVGRPLSFEEFEDLINS